MRSALANEGDPARLLRDCRVFDYERLMAFAAENAAPYAAAEPFPHIVIDDFIPESLVHHLTARYPDLRERPGQEAVSATMDDGSPAQAGKRWISRESAVDLAIRCLYWELNSGSFLGFLERLSGIPALLPDPYLQGGGLHETHRGGFLRVHADFNRHREMRLDRRLNLLIYLNPGWQPEWGGDLEFWDSGMTRCQQRVSPVGGRCVIFSTSETSYHGHPHPLVCPQDVSRRSLALYYYTHSATDAPREHETLWQTLPGDREVRPAAE
jgi:hypothetical protein